MMFPRGVQQWANATARTTEIASCRFLPLKLLCYRSALMFRFMMLVLASVFCLPFPAEAAKSSEIILAEPTGALGPPKVARRDKNLTIEVCALTCDYFVASKVRSEDEVWDAVFLHQAFFDEGPAPKFFRMKHGAHVSFVMATYAQKCSKYPQDATRATCIVKYLAGRNRISYAHVKYDGGYRCEVAGELLAASNTAGKTRCAPVSKTR
jgi:hypothetical protein